MKASWFSVSNSASLQTIFSKLVVVVALFLAASGLAIGQDTGYISGTVTDKSGAAVAGADVNVTSVSGSVTRSTTTNGDGAYAVAGLAGGTYHLTVSAKGFQKFTAQNVVLNVAEKARIDVQLTVGAVTEEVVVTGESVAQVETTSSDLSGTVNGKQITELQLNGRNFTQLATIVPGVSNQTGQDEGTVGVYGNVAFSFNGGRTEYNNWELDGGDNMDNGSNATLNVYPSVDAIAEFKVLTSNYGAQYGRNASGTVEVETKSGTTAFHGDVYYFGRNDAMNALNFFDAKKSDPTQPVPKFKKHDFGYTIGGPVFIPNHYNSDKKKTFFFWSQEWRRDLVPGQVFHASVPTMAERAGDFTDVCTSVQFSSDCPNVPNSAAIPVDPNAAPLLAMIPEPTITDPVAALANCGGLACYNASPATPTHWREELIRIDHNFSSKFRATFRYIHDSWDTVTPTTLWAGGSFPTVQTSFVGPGTSFVTRLNAEVSPTLLNEFVASYTGDHIFLKNTGSGVVSRSSSGLTTTGIFPDFADKLPDISVSGNTSFNDFSEGQAYIPWDNANPTYTLRDNVTKIVGKHTMTFGGYFVMAQKNEQSSFGSVQGALNFSASNTVVGSGNAFADLLMGHIDSYSQASSAPKYYFRYKIFEPYFQDDWRVNKKLTLNLGLRISLFGTYREKYKQTFNFEPSQYTPGLVDIADGSTTTSGGVPIPGGALIDPTSGQPLAFNDPRVTNGVVQCGASGLPSGCVHGHVFNPGPRIGFAYDPFGDGKTAIRGGYGIFFEHGNGNEANVESLEATPPLVLLPSQPNIIGYTNIGTGGGEIFAFPLGFNTIDTKGHWPYVQQWNINVQHEFPLHFVSSVAYVGSKGTHLGMATDQNQVHSTALADNPYKVGEAIGSDDCSTFTTPSGVAITGQAAINLNIACGGDPNPNRPFVGYGSLPFIQYQANSNYNSLQASLSRSIAPLTLSLAYTYSHSIDDSSDRGDLQGLLDSYDVRRARASSNFDQRHMLNISYVYALPFFRRATGITQKLLGDWQWAGITSIQTGTPFSVTYSGFSDNAGVSNGLPPIDGFPATFVDVTGDPKSNPGSCALTAAGPQLYNPCAFAAPRGLTFGNAGRNILRNPRVTNFDMSLAKNFKFNENTGFQFRAEAFNVFNHTEWSGVSNDFTSTDFLHPNGAHRARTLQLGLKFLF